MNLGWYVNVLIGVALQAVLFWRAFRSRLWSTYPFFYTYLVYTTVWTLVFGFPLFVNQPGYARAYWWTYGIAGILRFGIAVEIYRYVFPADLPLRGRASVFVLMATLVLLFVFLILMPPTPGSSALPDGMRKIALTVATMILLILGMARFYGVSIGRNLWSMGLGLLIFMGSDIMLLATMDLIPQLQVVCRHVHPVAFNVMLIVWITGLWRYRPNPPRPALDKALAEELVQACEHGWAELSTIVRHLVKP